MLNIEDCPKFILPVVVNTAAIQGTLTATFAARPISEMKELEKACAEDGSGIVGVVKAVTTGICDVSFPQIKFPEFPSAEEAIAALLDWPGVSTAMHIAYYKGLWDAKEKN